MEKSKFNWSSLIGPAITLLIVLGGVLVTFSQLQSQTGYTEKDLGRVETKVNKIDDDLKIVISVQTEHSSKLHQLESIQPTIQTKLNEFQTCVQDMRVQQAQFQSELSSDVRYIKEAIMELKQQSK